MRLFHLFQGWWKAKNAFMKWYHLRPTASFVSLNALATLLYMLERSMRLKAVTMTRFTYLHSFKWHSLDITTRNVFFLQAAGRGVPLVTISPATFLLTLRKDIVQGVSSKKCIEDRSRACKLDC